jgi:nicotinamidase-related amidase
MPIDFDVSRYTRPDLRAAALITIDTQRDFLDGAPCAIPGTSAILPALGTIAEAFRATSRPVIHVVRVYKRDGSNVDLCRRPLVEGGKHMVLPGTEGVELAQQIMRDPLIALDTERLLSGALQEVGPAEWIMYKPRWGAFYGTRLEEQLRAIGATTLVFAGCNFPNCPRTSIYEASERDFRVVLAEEAVSGLYDQGRLELRNIGVHLMKTGDLVRQLHESLM